MPLDFTSYVKRVAKPPEMESAKEAAARMSKDELREFLLVVPDVDWRSITRRDFLLYRAGNEVGAELLRREGTAALDWSFATGNKAACAALLRAVYAADPKSAGKYTVTFFTTFESDLGWDFVGTGVNAAAMRGVNDLVEALKLWEGSGGTDSIRAFAPGFDFAAFFAKCEPGRVPTTALVAWVGQDPDAAGAAIARGLREGQEWNDADTALQSRALLVGETEAARWLAPIIDAASGESRSMAVRALANDITPARAAALVAELPTDRDRIDLFLGGSARDFDGSGVSLKILRAFPSEDLRLRALSDLYSGKGRVPHSLRTREARLDHLEKVAAKIGLSEATKRQLLSVIPEE
jgi:hypothetical protein